MKTFAQAIRPAFPLALTVCFLAACGDSDKENDANVDASTDPPASNDASTSPDAAATKDAAASGDAPNVLRAACDLLPAPDVGAVLGVAQKATSLSGGTQCEYASTDTTKKDARAVLEVVPNGRAIYAGTIQMCADSGRTVVPQSGIGDQAGFLSDSMVRSSLFSSVGDVYVRLNLGWSDPGVSTDTQLSGERKLVLQAVGVLSP